MLACNLLLLFDLLALELDFFLFLLRLFGCLLALRDQNLQVLTQFADLFLGVAKLEQTTVKLVNFIVDLLSALV